MSEDKLVRSTSVPDLRRRKRRGSGTITIQRASWSEHALDFQPPPLPVPQGNVLPPQIIPLPQPSRRPAQLQHAVEAKLLTFDELAREIGHDPHADKTFKNRITGRTVTVKKMSTAYKEIQAASGDLEGTVNAKLDGFDPANRDQLEQTLNDQLDEAKKAALAYKAKHRKKPAKAAAADKYIQGLDDYKNTLKSGLDAIFADPAFDDVKGDLNLQQALAAKRRGINFADCKFDEHNDDKLDRGNSRDGFGAGAVNSVSLLVHEDGEMRIFKPEPLDDPKIKPGPRNIGIDPKAPHYGNRNIASKLAADVLGVSSMPEASFALHNGEVGLMMSKANGESPRVKEWAEIDVQGGGGTNGLNPQQIQEWAEKQGPDNRKNYRIEKKGGRWMQFKEVIKQPWQGQISDEAKDKLQEQLNDLEWTDMLTGQVDRHSANYFVDVQGDDVKVVGIDNDFAFGKNQKSLLQYNPGTGVTTVGQPKLIDAKTCQKLIDGDFDRDMRPKLEGLLTDEEIDAAADRFNAVKALAQNMRANGLEVANWRTWRSQDQPPKTAAEYLEAANTPSLFKRDLARFM